MAVNGADPTVAGLRSAGLAALANWLSIAGAIATLIIVARRGSGAHTAIFGAQFRSKKSGKGNFLR